MQPTNFEIPPEIRAAADKSVEEARRAFEQVLTATQKALSTAEGSAKSVGEGAADLSRQSLAYMEENIAATFSLAQRLVQARTPQEIAALQQEYLRQQMKALTEQGKALGEMATRLAATAAPKAKK